MNVQRGERTDGRDGRDWNVGEQVVIYNGKKGINVEVGQLYENSEGGTMQKG